MFWFLSGMLKNFFKIAIRNIRKKKVHSFINIAGLSVGMAVAMIISLWIYDELSFNTYHKNYNSIARVMQHTTVNGQVFTSNSQPVPLYEALQTKYSGEFKHVVISSYNEEQIISYGDQFFDEHGYYMESGAPEMLSLEMVKGVQNGLNGVNDIMISKSLSNRLFGKENPVNKVITINKRTAVKVTGVYKDLPKSSEFYNTNFIAPWKLYVASNEWMKQFMQAWEFDVSRIFVEVNKDADIEKVSKKIQNVINDHLTADQRKTLSDISLHPMSKWHLYEDFKDGINTGGKIQFVWLFGIIGIAVLVLACINFMNLSTARSEQRTKEVGIRKAIGSLRSQLIYQFFSESFVTVIIAFIFSLIILYFNLSWFNAIADKDIVIPWTNPYFWIGSTMFITITGILAGSYPAIYLSSFGVLKALKGSFRVGHMAAMPRYVLVVIQFTVSIVLIIGTIIIYHQVKYSKGRPVGYDQNGLISIKLKTNNIHDHFDVIRNKLTKDGIITDIAEASAPASSYSSNLMGFDWRGKDPNFTDNFNATWVSHDYGKTIEWKVKQGRDFSKERTTDRSGIILNISAVKYMGLENPVGEIVKYQGKDWTIIGVVDDIVLESPYQVIRPAMFMLSEAPMNVVLFKLNPRISTHEGLEKSTICICRICTWSSFEFSIC